MSPPDSDESKRNYRPPPPWPAKYPSFSQPDPPITKYITLPERVTVAYLAEITSQREFAVLEQLSRLRIFLGKTRGVDFEGAAKLLRAHGIEANRED